MNIEKFHNSTYIMFILSLCSVVHSLFIYIIILHAFRVFLAKPNIDVMFFYITHGLPDTAEYWNVNTPNEDAQSRYLLPLEQSNYPKC